MSSCGAGLAFVRCSPARYSAAVQGRREPSGSSQMIVLLPRSHARMSSVSSGGQCETRRLEGGRRVVVGNGPYELRASADARTAAAQRETPLVASGMLPVGFMRSCREGSGREERQLLQYFKDGGRSWGRTSDLYDVNVSRFMESSEKQTLTETLACRFRHDLTLSAWFVVAANQRALRCRGSESSSPPYSS